MQDVEQWKSHAAEVNKKHGFPDGLLNTLIQTESNWNNKAVSNKGAVGLAQFMKPTADEFGLKDREDPIASIDTAAKYLAYLNKYFDGDWVRTVAAYNGGMGAVKRHGGILPNKENQDYVRKIGSKVNIGYQPNGLMPSIEAANRIELSEFTPFEHDYTDRVAIETAMKEQLASDRAAYAAMSIGRPELYEQIKADYMATGKSPIEDEIRYGSVRDTQTLRIQNAGQIVQSDEFNDETKNAVIEQIKTPPSIYDVNPSTEFLVKANDAATAQATNENDFQVSSKGAYTLEESLHYNGLIAQMISDLGKRAFKPTFKLVFDIGGTFTSLNDVNSYTAFMDHIKLKYDPEDMLFPGLMLTELRKYVAGLSPREQYELAFTMQEFLQENAGALFDGNLVQAVTMMSDVFNTNLGGDPNSFDINPWLMSMGPLFEIASIGTSGVVKGAIMAPFRFAKESRMRRITAANPEAGAKSSSEAMKSEKAAEMLGETPEELVVKSNMPKPEGTNSADVPPIVNEHIDAAISPAEVLKQAEDNDIVIAGMRGDKDYVENAVKELKKKIEDYSLWTAATEISGGVGEPFRATVTVGKNDKYGFADLKEAEEINKTVFGGKGIIHSRKVRTDEIKEVIRPGMEEEAAKAKLIEELKLNQEVKLSRGQQKEMRREIRELRQQIGKIQEPIDALKANPPVVQANPGTNRKAAEQHDALMRHNDQVAALTREIEPLQRQIDELNGLLEASNFGYRAEQNISRLQQNQIDKLDKDVATRLGQLLPEQVIQGVPGDEATEYFIKLNSKGDVSFVNGDVAIVRGGSVLPFIFDADSKVSKRIAGMAHAMFDKWRGMEKEILGLFDPFTKLKRADQVTLSNLILEGNKKGKVWRARDFREAGLGKDAFKAYRNFQKAMRTMYVLENKMLRESLVRDGAKYVAAGDYKGFGNALSDEAARGVVKAYNPKTKTIEKVPVDWVDSGNGIAKLRKTKIVGDEGSNYIMMSEGDSISELPDKVLRNRAGWMPQTHESNFFITETRDILVDGVKQPRTFTVGVATDLTEATRIVDKLNEKAPLGTAYGKKHDRSLVDPAEYAESIHDLYSVNGGLFYSSRREGGLTNLAGIEPTESKIRDPLEAAVKGIARVTRDASIGRYTSDLKMRFIETYNDVLTTPGRYPQSLSDIRNPTDGSDRMVAEARQMWRQIETFDGLGTDIQALKKGIVIAADIIETGGNKQLSAVADWIRSRIPLGSQIMDNLPITSMRRKTAEKLRDVKDVDPVGWIRARNFELQLASNPVSQLLVQPTQTLNMIPLSGRHFFQDFRRGEMVSRLAREKADVLLTKDQMGTFAKTLGMDVEELIADVRMFRRSGGGAAIRAHETARDAQTTLKADIEGGVSKVMSRVGDVYRKPIAFMSKHGFEKAEEINIGVHWQVAKRRWMDQNSGQSPYTPKAAAEIQGITRQLSGSMTRTGDFGYQRGLWSIPTQFLAAQHKQFLLMTTNKQLTFKEKMKIAGTQLALWGPAGLGMEEVVRATVAEADLDLPEGAMEVVVNAIADGAVEYSLNGLINMMEYGVEFYTGEEQQRTDLNFNDRYASAAGWNDNIATFAASVLIDNQLSDVWGMFLGPSVTPLNRVGNFMNSASIMLGTDDLDTEDFEVVAEDFLRILGGYSQIAKARVWANDGGYRDKNGKLIFETTGTENVFKSLFGINPEQLERHYAAGNMVRNREENIKKLADEYYQHMLKLSDQILEETSGLPLDTIMSRYQAALKVHKSIIAAEREDADEIFQQVRNRMEANIKTKGEDELARKVIDLHIKSGGAPSTQRIVNYLLNENMISPEQVPAISEMIDRSVGKGEE